MGCTTSKEKDEPYDSRQTSKPPLASASAAAATAAANGEVQQQTAGGGGVATDDQGQGQLAIGEGEGDKQPAATDNVTTDDAVAASGEVEQASPEEPAAVEVEKPIVEEAPVVPVQAIRVKEMPRLVIEDFAPFEHHEQVNTTHTEVSEEQSSEPLPEEELVSAEKSVADESAPRSAEAVTDDVINDQPQALVINEVPAADAAVEEERVTPTVRINRSDEKARVLGDLSSDDLPLYCHEEPVTRLQNLRFKEFPQLVQDHFKEQEELSSNVPLHRSRASTPDAEAPISPDDAALTAEIPVEPEPEATVVEEEIAPVVLIRQRGLPAESDDNSNANSALESRLHGFEPAASTENSNQVQLNHNEATSESAAAPTSSANVNGSGVLQDENLLSQLQPQPPFETVEQSTSIHKDTSAPAFAVVDDSQNYTIDTTAVSDSA